MLMWREAQPAVVPFDHEVEAGRKSEIEWESGKGMERLDLALLRTQGFSGNSCSAV